jgi:hypothetical protein
VLDDTIVFTDVGRCPIVDVWNDRIKLKSTSQSLLCWLEIMSVARFVPNPKTLQMTESVVAQVFNHGIFSERFTRRDLTGVIDAVDTHSRGRGINRCTGGHHTWKSDGEEMRDEKRRGHGIGVRLH